MYDLHEVSKSSQILRTTKENAGQREKRGVV